MQTSCDLFDEDVVVGGRQQDLQERRRGDKDNYGDAKGAADGNAQVGET